MKSGGFKLSALSSGYLESFGSNALIIVEDMATAKMYSMMCLSGVRYLQFDCKTILLRFIGANSN